MLSEQDLINHIVDACRRIGRYIAGKSYDDFLRDELLQDGVVRQLEIIGEASKRIPETLRHTHGNLPWKQMAGMRDRLIHGYDMIDLRLVWDAAAASVPQLLAVLGPRYLAEPKP
jgi:uncharacterized protein with HEPN domain